MTASFLPAWAEKIKPKDYARFLPLAVREQRKVVTDNPKGAESASVAMSAAESAILEESAPEQATDLLESIEASIATLLADVPEAAVHLRAMLAGYSVPIENEARYQTFLRSQTMDASEEATDIPEATLALEWLDTTISSAWKLLTTMAEMDEADEKILEKLIKDSLAARTFATDDDGKVQTKSGEPVLKSWDGPLRPDKTDEKTGAVLSWKPNLRNVPAHLQRPKDGEKKSGRGTVLSYFVGGDALVNVDGTDVPRGTPLSGILARFLSDVTMDAFYKAFDEARKDRDTSAGNTITFDLGEKDAEGVPAHTVSLKRLTAEEVKALNKAEKDSAK